MNKLLVAGGLLVVAGIEGACDAPLRDISVEPNIDIIPNIVSNRNL
jgi:hypothetical protein